MIPVWTVTGLGQYPNYEEQHLKKRFRFSGLLVVVRERAQGLKSLLPIP